MDTTTDKRLKKKTPAAVLRSLLTEEKEIEVVRWSKRLQQEVKKKKKVRVRLSADTVAGWLGCSRQNVTDIECAKVLRKKLKNGQVREEIRRLRFEQAELFAKQTDADIGYLLGDNLANPIDSHGNPYRQATFDRCQARLEREKNDGEFPARMAQFKLAQGVRILAAILLRAFQDGKADVVASKVIKTLRELYLDVDKTGIDRNGLFGTRPKSMSTATRPDLKDTLDLYEAQFRKLLGKRRWPPPDIKAMIERKLAQPAKRKTTRR